MLHVTSLEFTRLHTAHWILRLRCYLLTSENINRESKKKLEQDTWYIESYGSFRYGANAKTKGKQSRVDPDICYDLDSASYV